MQIIYLLPFVLLSGTLSVIFLVVPRLRRHVIAAAVAPIAFAGCSIVGVFATIMIAEHFGLDRLLGFDAPVGGAGQIAMFFSVYVFFGAVGATVAITIVTRIQRWVVKARFARCDPSPTPKQ